ncbi:MAG TPA: hypothetical protein VF079_01040 [Sphingomicrobium sp.]
MRTSAVVLGCLLLAGCASGNAPPSLLPRAAEGIDPRGPVVRPMNDRPVDPALAGQLAALVVQARSGDAAFQPAAAEAERLAAAAGEAQSESWVAAQQALSAAIAAREPTARALGDIDALGATKLQAQAGLAPNDLAAIRDAGAEVGAIDQRQAGTIAAIKGRLDR